MFFCQYVRRPRISSVQEITSKLAVPHSVVVYPMKFVTFYSFVSSVGHKVSIYNCDKIQCGF